MLAAAKHYVVAPLAHADGTAVPIPQDPVVGANGGASFRKRRRGRRRRFCHGVAANEVQYCHVCVLEP